MWVVQLVRQNSFREGADQNRVPTHGEKALISRGTVSKLVRSSEQTRISSSIPNSLALGSGLGVQSDTDTANIHLDMGRHAPPDDALLERASESRLQHGSVLTVDARFDPQSVK
jgi:hypothetical protein